MFGQLVVNCMVFFRILLVRLPLSAVIADEERGSGCYERILYVLNLN